MIQFDFYYRKRDSSEPSNIGTISIYDVEKKDEEFSCLVTSTEPLEMNQQIFGVDPLNCIEQAFRVIEASMSESKRFYFWRWEGCENDGFEFFFPSRSK